MPRATDELFDLLHGSLAESMLEQLKAYREPREDSQGNLQPGEIPAAFLGQCLKFLKDNGIDSPARAQKIHDTLAGHMPTFDDDDATPMRGTH